MMNESLLALAAVLFAGPEYVTEIAKVDSSQLVKAKKLRSARKKLNEFLKCEKAARSSPRLFLFRDSRFSDCGVWIFSCFFFVYSSVFFIKI